MTPTYRRIIAAVGVVFAILATGSLMTYFFLPDLWGGALGVVSVFCYIITFGLFFLIKLNDGKEKEDKSIFKFPETNPDNSASDDSDKEEADKKSAVDFKDRTPDSENDKKK